MEELRWEDIGRISRSDYIDREKVEKIRSEGFELITVYGDIERKIKFGNPIYGVFRPTCVDMKAEPAQPVGETIGKQVVDEPQKEKPGKRKSFADRVREEKAKEGK